MSESTGTDKPPEKWAIVEIFGHRELAGRIHGAPPFTEGIVIDIPLSDGNWAQEYYGKAAIFGARIVPEASAREFARRSWHVQQTYPLALPAAAEEEAPFEGEEEAPFEGEEEAPFEGEEEPTRSDARDLLYDELDDEIDEMHGAPTLRQWIWNIEDRTSKLTSVAKGDMDGARTLLIELGALAIATIEHIDDRGPMDDEEQEDADPPEDLLPPERADQDDLPQ